MSANGSGGSQTIVTGSSSTLRAEIRIVTNKARPVNLNRLSGSNSGSVFQFNNLSIGGSASTTSVLKLATTSGYGMQIAGTTSVTGPAAVVNFSGVPSDLPWLRQRLDNQQLLRRCRDSYAWQAATASSTMPNSTSHYR